MTPVNTKPAADPLRVLCVDDNDILADSLQRYLEREPGLEWAGIIREGREIWAGVMAAKPDIVLMDIDMPETDTFSIVRRLSDSLPETRVIMFSGHVTPAYIETALDSGAWGYLSKNDGADLLVAAMKRVATGEFAFSKEVETILKRQ